MSSIEDQITMSERLPVITQQIGFSLWQIQELENVTAQYFVLLVQAEKGMGLNAGDDLIEKALKGTFGTTIRRITDEGLFQPDLKDRFLKLLSERNWLVHRSKADSRSAVHNNNEMDRLLCRLESMSDEALELLKEINLA